MPSWIAVLVIRVKLSRSSAGLHRIVMIAMKMSSCPQPVRNMIWSHLARGVKIAIHSLPGSRLLSEIMTANFQSFQERTPAYGMIVQPVTPIRLPIVILPVLYAMPTIGNPWTVNTVVDQVILMIVMPAIIVIRAEGGIK